MQSLPIAYYKGFALIDEMYPDDDGFYKHTFYCQDETQPGITIEIPGMSSYETFENAVDLFNKFVDNIISTQENQ